MIYNTCTFRDLSQIVFCTKLELAQNRFLMSKMMGPFLVILGMYLNVCANLYSIFWWVKPLFFYSIQRTENREKYQIEQTRKPGS